MRRRKMLYALGGTGAVLLPSGLTAAALNSFNVDREATIGVEADDSAGAILGLDPGDSSIVSTEADALTIDVGDAFGGNASGVNVDANLVVGDSGADFSSNPNEAAFSVTNQADGSGTSRDFTVSYTVTGTDSAAGTDNVTFTFYDSSSSLVATVTESSDATLSLEGGVSRFATLTVDTANLSSTDDLSGTLGFSYTA